jgi:vancomycin resistance protein YoaR
VSAEPLYPHGQQPASVLPHADEHIQTARPRPPRRNTGMLVVAIIASLLAITSLGIGSGLFYLDRSFAGKIYPNVMIQGVAVGEYTPEQAEAAIRARYGTFLDRPATVRFDQTTLTPSLQELGMQFDFAGAVDQAYRAGRGHGMIDNVREVWAIWQNGLDLPLAISYDEQKTQRYVRAIAAGLEIEPRDASIEVDGSQVRTTSAQIGRQILVNEAVTALSAGLRSFQPVDVQIQDRILTPRLLDEPVRKAANQLNEMLNGSISLTVGEQAYSWEPDALARMIQVARVPQAAGDTISVSINPYPIERIVKQIADETEQIGTRPRLSWNEGQLEILVPGDNGWRVDEARARDLFLTALQGGPRSAELPMREVAPPINETNLDQLGITDLVSIGKSDFTGSASYRVHNIGVGMKILNGILIAPGEEFSFNQHIGNIDASQGFVEGSAIVQNRTQQEFGGGICQDSTTLFRAAFWAGLPITERWGHSFYISWYNRYALGDLGSGPGMDATIFTGGPDLKFVNDTGSWLLLQSWSNPRSGIAQVELYGTKINRRVELSHRVYDQLPAPTDPVFVADAKQPAGSIKHSDKSRGGMTIDIVRTVYVDGVAREPDRFRTRFKPWPNIYVLNPADMGPDGRPAIPWQDPNAPPPVPAPEQPPAADPAAPPPAPEPPAPVPTGQLAGTLI